MVNTVFIFTSVGLFCMLLSHIADTTQYKNKQKISLVALVTFLSCLSGLRSIQVGIDTKGYADIFLNISNYKNVEPGFLLLKDILMGVFNSSVWVFLIIAFLINGLFVARLWSFRKISPMWLSVFVYYTMIFFSTMSGIRQWLAAAIIFYATKYILDVEKDKKHYIKFILAVIIASTFHTSALISVLFLVPDLLKRAKNTKMQVVKMIGIILLPVLSIFVYNELTNRYGYFLFQNIEDSSIGYMIPFRLLILLVLFIFIKKRRLESDKNKSIMQTLIFIELITLLTSGLGYFWQTASRVSWYFLPFTAVLYGSMLNKKRFKSFVELGSNIGIIIVCFYSYLTIFTDVTNKLVPFTFFWQ